MPMTMGGMASGVDTEGIIKKLVEVEAQPLKKIEREIQEYNQKIRVLENLQKLLKDLEAAVKELYGFRASYDAKKAISSNEAALIAVANKTAEIGKRKISIQQLASNHRIISDAVDINFEIPAGSITIEVNGEKESMKFRGGNIEKFRNAMSEQFSDLINVTVIKTSVTDEVLVLESKTPGEKGEMLITGDQFFLKKIGLISGMKNEEKDDLKFIFDTKYFTQYEGEDRKYDEDGKLEVSQDGKSVDIEGILWREFELPSSKILKKETVLTFETEYTPVKPPEEEEEALPYKIEIGPKPKTVIKGIELEGYNVSRERPLEKKPKPKNIENKIGIGVVYEEGGVRKEKIYQLNIDTKGKQTIPVGEEFEGKVIKKIVLYSNEGEVKFHDMRLSTPLKGDNLLQPKNTIAEAKNSKFKVDGIPVEREKNDGLSDIMKGVTINLRAITGDEEVDVDIEHDIEKAIDKINKFVKAYNSYLDYNDKITKAAMVKDADEYDTVKKESGILVGNMTLLRLENALKRAVSSAYHSRVENPIKILSEIGVTTGKVGTSFKSTRDNKGKLSVDNDILKQKIMENPKGVDAFFGTDNDGDNRIDSGLGFTLENVLKPYIQTGKNLISVEIQSKKDSIKRSQERAKRLQAHLKSYEEKLRKKFSNMEQSVSGSKSQQQWMNQQSGGGGQ